MKPAEANETKQERSRQTLERILSAAEELLQDRDFGDLTMAQLAEHAGCAVGTLYGRIPSKERLLACLYERLQTQIGSLAGEAFRTGSDLPLRERIRILCEMSVEFLHATRGVNRAVTQHLWSQDGDDFGFRRGTTAHFKKAAAFLAECADEVDHADARQACEFGLMTVSAMAQDRIVFGARSGLQIRYSRRALKDQLTSLLTAYLTSPG